MACWWYDLNVASKHISTPWSLHSGHYFLVLAWVLGVVHYFLETVVITTSSSCDSDIMWQAAPSTYPICSIKGSLLHSTHDWLTLISCSTLYHVLHGASICYIHNEFRGNQWMVLSCWIRFFSEKNNFKREFFISENIWSKLPGLENKKDFKEVAFELRPEFLEGTSCCKKWCSPKVHSLWGPQPWHLTSAWMLVFGWGELHK